MSIIMTSSVYDCQVLPVTLVRFQVEGSQLNVRTAVIQKKIYTENTESAQRPTEEKKLREPPCLLCEPPCYHHKLSRLYDEWERGKRPLQC